MLKPPPFGSRGRVGDNRGIEPLLNNKQPRSQGFSLEIPISREKPWERGCLLFKSGAAVKRETGYQSSKDGGRRRKGKCDLIHAYLAFSSTSNVIDIQSESSNLFSIVCGYAFINMCVIVASN